ncbi:MAG: T9SS type A sorting domain-containing protein [Saprospiraceae bacterium]
MTIYANTNPIYNFVTIKGEISKVEKMVGLDKNKIIEQANDSIKILDRNCSTINSYPLNEIIHLELKEYINKVAAIEIRNEIGKKIMSKEIGLISKESTRLKISEFPSGTYIVTIFIDNEEPMNQCFVVTGK